jgi:hypothetical protein
MQDWWYFLTHDTELEDDLWEILWDALFTEPESSSRDVEKLARYKN